MNINNWYNTFLQNTGEKGVMQWTRQMQRFQKTGIPSEQLILSDRRWLFWLVFTLLNINRQMKGPMWLFTEQFWVGHAYPCLSGQNCSKSWWQLGISASCRLRIIFESNLSRQVFFWCKRFQSGSLFLKTQLTNSFVGLSPIFRVNYPGCVIRQKKSLYLHNRPLS